MHSGDTLLMANDKVVLRRKGNGQTSNTTQTRPNAQDEYDEIKRRGFVRIGSQSSAPPLNYVDDNGKRKGLDFEIAQLIFKQSEFGFTNPNSISADHWVDEYDKIPELLNSAPSGGHNVDIIMGGLTYQDGDNPNIIYSDPYLEDFGYSLVSKNGDGINTLRDLRNGRIGVVKGDIDVKQYVQGILPPGAKIIELSDELDTWIRDNITDGVADAVVYDFPFASSELKNMGGRGNLKIKISKLPSSDISYRIGLRKGNEKLRDKLNAAIRKIKDMPQYSILLKKYLKTDNVVVPRNSNNNPTHMVQNGETLSIIAINHLGNLDRWTEIQELNNIPNPHLINVGQALIMPTDYR
jgi:ABC-type amino acid transport substrate-binding protein